MSSIGKKVWTGLDRISGTTVPRPLVVVQYMILGGLRHRARQSSVTL